MRNMCGEVGNQVPGSGSSPGSHGGVPATTGEDGVRNTDQGWTVFQITSTPATLLAVGSDSCGPDRARTRSSSIVRQARPRPRPGVGCRHRHGGGPEAVGGLVSRGRGGRRLRFHRGLPSRALVFAVVRGAAGSYLVFAAGVSFLPLRLQRMIKVGGGTERSAAAPAF